MFLQDERVTKRSSQWPCMCVGNVTCCFVLNEARISLHVVVVVDGYPN